MTWQLLVVAYLFFGTGSYLVRRSLAQSLSEHNRLVNAFFFLAVLYPTGLVFALFSQHNLSIGWTNFLFILFGSSLFPIINILAYKASKHVDAGLYTILNNLTPIVTIIAASLLLNETLNTQQLAGAIIIILSAFLATLPRILHRHITKTEGIYIAVLSVSLLGLAIVFERWMLTRMDFGAYLVYGWGAQTFWSVAFALADRQRLNILFTKRNFKPVLWYGLANTFKGICFVGALKLSDNASLVSAAVSFMAVTVVLAAYVFLKEREYLVFKIIAAIVGTIGLIILNIS